MQQASAADLTARVALLERRLERERSARRTAEEIGERATSELFEAVQNLQRAQAEIQGRADQARTVTELAREVRRELDLDGLLQRAARGLGEALGADSCTVRLTAGDRAAAPARWARPGSGCDGSAGTPLGDPAVELAGGSPAGRWESTRAATPVLVGEQLVGWLELESAQPRSWTERDVAIAEGLARELGAAVSQARVYADQQATVDRLRELDLAKTEFVSTVSHELRTPLTSITGYLEMLLEEALGELTPHQVKALTVIDRNAQRLQLLIGDLLTLSGVDAGAFRLDLAPGPPRHGGRRRVRRGPPAARAAGARHRGRGAGRPRCGPRRRHPARAGGQQPAHERREVHPRRRPDPGRRGRRRARGVAVGGRYRLRDPLDEQDRLFTRFFRSTISQEQEIQGSVSASRSPRRSSTGTAAGWTSSPPPRPAPRSPSGCRGTRRRPGSPERGPGRPHERGP